MKNGMVSRVKSAAAAIAMLASLALAAQALAAKALPAQPVDINKASAEELMSLPGVGPAKAQAIIAYRQATPFASTDELVNVKGIGEKLFAKIAPYVTVAGQAASGQSGKVSSGTAEKATK